MKTGTLIPTAVMPLVGTSIEEAVDQVCALADDQGRAITLEFNGIRIEVQDRYLMLLSELVGRRQAYVAAYHAACELETKRRRRSAKGRWAALKRIMQRWYMERTIAAEERRGFSRFAIKNRELWDARLAIEADDRLGTMLLRYAARWANYMERELRRGKTVLECAGVTSHKADIEGMSGASWNISMNLLIAVWEHGDELAEYKATTWVGAAERGQAKRSEKAKSQEVN